MRQYLLGRLLEEDEERVELRLLTDGNFSEELDIVADELIDQYVEEEELSAEERQHLERYFFKSSERLAKLRFALALKQRKSELLSKAYQRRKLFRLYLPIAASVLIALTLGAWWVFFSQSDVDKGMAALQRAYREQRPVEARISGLVSYAPLIRQRGAEKIDYVQRDRAAGLLAGAAINDQTANAYHALGQYYLAERQFDRAIEQLNTALSLNPQNAKIHSDLGAALFENGKARSPESGQGTAIKEFAESLKHLNQALGLDNSLLAALFNRALLHEQMGLIQQAEDDWKTYLQRDPDSRWAAEAQEKLRLLEEQRKRTSKSSQEIFQEFLRAYDVRDHEAAWQLVSSYHNRTGNVIVEQLLDAFLEKSAQGDSEEAGHNLRLLAYAADLEKQRAGERFFSDLTEFYKSSTAQQRAALTEARTLMRASHEGWGRLRTEENLDLFSRAKQLFEQAGDVYEAGFAEYWMSHCFYRLRRQEQTRATLTPLAAFCESNGYIWLLVRCLYLLSSTHYDVNEYSKAVDIARRSVELAERARDSVGVLNAVSSLIEYYRCLGNYQKSLDYIQHSLPLVKSISLDPIQGARHYGFVAVSFTSVGLHDAAADYQSVALSFALSTGRDVAISSNYAFLGMINGKLKNFEAALRNAGRAFDIARARDEKSLMAYSYLQLGNIYKEAGDFDKAVENYSQAVGLYEQLNAPTHLYQAHKGRLLCYIAQKNDQSAAAEINTTLALIEKYRKQIYQENNRNTFFDIEQSVYDAAIDFEFSRLNNPQKAFEYLESSRARSLLDLLQADKEVLVKVHDPDIIFRSASQPLTLEEIQRHMPAQAQILQYAVLENKLLIWVIQENKSSAVVREVTQRELTEKVSGYLQMISRPSEYDAAEAARRARELFKILISPVEALLDRNKEICVIPDKILSRLSFAALLSPSSDRYLIEEYVLMVSPSPSVFIICSERAKQKEHVQGERILSVGNPRIDAKAFPGFPDLPSATREAATVALFYNNSPAPLTEDRASLAAVMNEMGGANVIHFALHSSIDEGFPLRSKLLLAKNRAEMEGSAASALHAYEIYNLKLSQARLVVLSACQTGAERYYGGEGMSSLARAFIAADIPLVVASLWPVDSDSTAELMISFHKNRTQGNLSTARALRSQQVEMLRRPDGRFRHPYYWASFTLIGGHAGF